MDEQMVDEIMEEVPEIPEELEKIMIMALDEGKAKMESGELLVPFTAIAVKDNLFIESHPGDDADACFEKARKVLEGAAGASAYAFCYDGFVDTEDGELDCIIAEGGLPGEEFAYVIGYVYTMDDDQVVSIDEEPVFVDDEAENHMANLKPANKYTDDQISAKYTNPDGFEAE